MSSWLFNIAVGTSPVVLLFIYLLWMNLHSVMYILLVIAVFILAILLAAFYDGELKKSSKPESNILVFQSTQNYFIFK